MAEATQTAQPYEINRDDAPAFWSVGILWMILADQHQTGGALTVIEQVCPRNSGPPPHTHAQQESFYVLDGQMTLVVGGRTLTATQGSFVSVPPDTVHSFRVDTETARILNFYVPAGFERLITETGEAATERTLPPSHRGPMARQVDMKRLVQEIGMTWVDEPDVLRQQN